MDNMEQYAQEAISLRRALHKIPERGLNEFETQRFIMQKLEAYGVDSEPIAQTGVLAFFDYGFEYSIMLRADIDALPIAEQTELSFASIHDGFMHACGHDGHSAMLLTTAKYLSEHRSGFEARANILLVFQPAEEGPGGAKLVVEAGVLEKYCVREIYGLHLTPDYPFGTLAAPSGEFFACGVELYFTINGRGAHAAQPHRASDSILAAAQLITSLQSVISRSISPTTAGVLTIGTIEGGTAQNAIAECVKLSGALRAFDSGVRDKMLSRIAQICAGVGEACGCSIDFSPIVCYPPLKNDAALWGHAKARLKERFSPAEKVMLSEDFAYYCDSAPSLFMFLGFGDGKPAHAYPLHSPKFDFDDSVLIFGASALLDLTTKE